MRYFKIAFFTRNNGQIDESVSVAKSLTQHDLDTSNVIIDFAEEKIVKCIIDNKKLDTTFEQCKEYYLNVYPGIINQLLTEAKITADSQKPKKLFGK